jgi:uncharacterized membrane protein YfcA
MLHWSIILIFLFFAVLVYATLGFGDSLILIPLLGLILDLRVGIVLAGFWAFFTNISNFYQYRQHFERKYTIFFGIAGAFGALIGSLLIGIAPLAWIQLVLGVFIFFFLIREAKAARQTECREVQLLPGTQLVVGGLIYGTLGGLIGASGPVNVMFLRACRLEKEKFIGTFASAGFLVGLIKIIVYLGTGLFPTEIWYVFVLGFPVIWLATRIGYRITPKIPIRTFRLFVLGLLAIMGGRMIYLAVDLLMM